MSSNVFGNVLSAACSCLGVKHLANESSWHAAHRNLVLFRPFIYRSSRYDLHSTRFLHRCALNFLLDGFASPSFKFSVIMDSGVDISLNICVHSLTLYRHYSIWLDVPDKG